MMLANRINDRGVIAGNVSWGLGARPVVWRNGTVTALEIPPDIDVESCFANDMNNRSQVVGRLTTGYGSRGFVWESGSIRLLPMRTTWPDETNIAFGINDWGAIVGGSTALVSEFEIRSAATLWFGDHVYDLNDLVDERDPLKPFVRLEGARRINNRGDVVVSGTDSRNPDGASYYLLTLFAPRARP